MYCSLTRLVIYLQWATLHAPCKFIPFSLVHSGFCLGNFHEPIRAIEWKSKSHFNGFLGHCRLYIGFEDGSISAYLLFRLKLYPVSVNPNRCPSDHLICRLQFEIQSEIIDNAGPGGPVRRLFYHENQADQRGDSGSVTFWSDSHSCGESRLDFLLVLEVHSTELDMWNKRKTMTYAELGPWVQDIENVTFNTIDTCVFILRGGYIL